MKVHTRFLLSALDERQFPAASLPEIAFLGRSNVGKSSLVNALLARTRSKVARVSATPGKTRFRPALPVLRLRGLAGKLFAFSGDNTGQDVRNSLNQRRFFMVAVAVSFQPSAIG